MSVSATASSPSAGTARRRWLRRLLIACLGPLLAVGALELGLRLAGYGYDTAFLQPASQGADAIWIPNPRFTWRFFGPERARTPATFALHRPKPDGVIRIFVLGESAAFGDPHPDFGLARMLQTLLELRFPAARFEVVNAAITGINSHTVLPIARSCAGAEGDIWVLYTGNNEVVGPFGAGTIFGPQAPPLPLIRTSLAARATRLGQALDALGRQFQPLPADKQAWGGMLMFVENQVPAQDARMASVYHHFRQNLEDILDLARRHEVPVVLSSIAVNLADCAPFASTHGEGVDADARARWKSLVGRAEEALARDAPEEALGLLGQAEAVDGSVADLHHLAGQIQQHLGKTSAAKASFQLACDLDVLRFRCDRRLNEIIRTVASQRDGRGVAFVDAARAFDGVDSPEFYDHVHLTFHATHRLATQIAQPIVSMLPPHVRVGAGAGTGWAPLDACAERLAWTIHSEAEAWTQMLKRHQDPPFTFQRGHAARLSRLRAQVLELSVQGAASGTQRQVAACREALTLVPGDLVLLQRLAVLLHAMQDLDEAETAARQVVEAMPHAKTAWLRLGQILIDQGAFPPAFDALRRARELDPRDGFTLHSIGRAWVQAGKTREATAAFEESIEMNPFSSIAYLGLARLQDESGRTREADANLRRALAHPMAHGEHLAALATTCLKRNWYPEALTTLLAAIDLNPADPTLRLQAGHCLDTLGKPAEARPLYQQALRLAPDLGEAHYLLGLSFGRARESEEALRHFEQAARLLPDLPEAHFNLAVARVQVGREDDAIPSLRAVLRLQPDHLGARQELARLQALSDRDGTR